MASCQQNLDIFGDIWDNNLTFMVSGINITLKNNYSKIQK